MPINLEKAKIRQAVTEKEFTQRWIADVSIRTPSPGEGEATIISWPYDPNTGEIYRDDGPIITHLNDFWNAIQEVPEIAIAMGAVLKSIPAVEAWKKSKEPIPTPEPEIIE